RIVDVEDVGAATGEGTAHADRLVRAARADSPVSDLVDVRAAVVGVVALLRDLRHELGEDLERPLASSDLSRRAAVVVRELLAVRRRDELVIPMPGHVPDRPALRHDLGLAVAG